jgi:hypothetical protein
MYLQKVYRGLNVHVLVISNFNDPKTISHNAKILKKNFFLYGIIKMESYPFLDKVNDGIFDNKP